MALNIKNQVVFNVQDAAGNYLFQAGPAIDYPLNLTQIAGSKFDVPASTTNMALPNLGSNPIQRLYFMADQALTVSLCPVGQTHGVTNTFTLVANAPSVLSCADIGSIYCSNPTSHDSLLVICALG